MDSSNVDSNGCPIDHDGVSLEYGGSKGHGMPFLVAGSILRELVGFNRSDLEGSSHLESDPSQEDSNAGVSLEAGERLQSKDVHVEPRSWVATRSSTMRSGMLSHGCHEAVPSVGRVMQKRMRVCGSSTNRIVQGVKPNLEKDSSVCLDNETLIMMSDSMGIQKGSPRQDETMKSSASKNSMMGSDAKMDDSEKVR